MAKLPSSADLGAPVSARSGRPIASVDTSAVQKGVIQLGKGLSSLGEAGLAYAKHQEAAEDYDTELKFRQFRFDQERDLDEQMRSVEPERATSFADEWTGGYKERAGQFLETVPPHLRGKYQLKIHETERDLYRPAQVFTRTEQKRQSTAKLDDFIDNSLVKSGNLERGRTELDELIERNPWLSPVEKDELRREKLKRFEQLHVKSMIERGENLDAIIRDLGGEPLDDMENPETRAKPFEGTAPGPRTHAGFSPASITARLETGQKDPLKGVASIAKDSNDSRSYGNFGLNSQGEAQQFVREYGDALGLSGEPGTDEFDRSWKAAAASDPEGLHQAELHWWSKTIEPRIVNDLGSSGVSAEVATDPRVKAYFADRLIQYGPASIGDHEERVKSAFDASGGNVEAFLRNMTEADRENLQRDFPSALRSGVYSQRGHDTRTYGRLNLALAGGGEQASLPTATDSYAGPYKNLSGEERLQLMHSARSRLRSSMEGAREQLKQSLDDDVASIRRTGQSTNPDVNLASRVLEPNQVNRYRLDRQEAEMEFRAMDGLASLPEAELQRRLDEIEPKPGEPLFEMKAKVFDKAKRAVDGENGIRDLRESDPARAVDQVPEVQQAVEAIRANPEDPQAIQNLARARLDAQGKVGVPEGLRSPITKAEARVIVSPLKGLEGKALTQALGSWREELEARYGPYARSAALSAIEYGITRDKDLAEVVESQVNNVFQGQPPSAAQARRAEFLTEISRASQAFGGDAVGEPMRQYGPIGIAQGVTGIGGEIPQGGRVPDAATPSQVYGMKRPPQGAIDLLISNPALAPQFNERFGPGAAELILSGRDQ